MIEDKQQKLAALRHAIYMAAWDCHHITGRTDQTVQQISELFPQHPDVLAWRKATEALAQFIKDGQ